MGKINIAELLKDCPKGMELDCTIWDNITLGRIDTRKTFPIEIKVDSTISWYLTKEGSYNLNPNAKCVIFPKGKTTWEGFVPPIKFKEGDVVFYDDTISIFKEWGDATLFRTYVCTYLCCEEIIDVNIPLFGKSIRREVRFATEEEKQRLFDAIKANGYRWDAETKKLKKLIEPEFKVGDVIISTGNNIHIISCRDKNNGWESCCGIIYGKFDSTKTTHVTPVRFATEEEKQKLFDAIKANGYRWDSETKTLEKLPKFKVGDRVKHISAYTSGIVVKVSDKGYLINYPKGGSVCYISFELEKNYELSPNKFDITTLKPFESWVLVRNSDSGFWKPAFWGIYEAEKTNEHQYRNYLTTEGFVRYCIPYNDETKHLLGTTNDCDEYYKTWEK